VDLTFTKIIRLLGIQTCEEGGLWLSSQLLALIPHLFYVCFSHYSNKTFKVLSFKDRQIKKKKNLRFVKLFLFPEKSYYIG